MSSTQVGNLVLNTGSEIISERIELNKLQTWGQVPPVAKKQP